MILFRINSSICFLKMNKKIITLTLSFLHLALDDWWLAAQHGQTQLSLTQELCVHVSSQMAREGQLSVHRLNTYYKPSFYVTN